MILLADVVRYVVVVLALLNSAMLIRLMWLRQRRRAENRWHGSANFFTTSGLVVLMLIGVLRRLDTLGDPPDIFLWGAVVGMALLTLGLSRTVTLRGYGHSSNTTHRRTRQ